MKGFALRFVLKQSYKRTRKKKLMAYLICMRLIRVSEEVLPILQSVRGQQICRKSNKQTINGWNASKSKYLFNCFLPGSSPRLLKRWSACEQRFPSRLSRSRKRSGSQSLAQGKNKIAIKVTKNLFRSSV